MGPWLRSHGRDGTGEPLRLLRWQLQWGRGFAATEGDHIGPDTMPYLSLQWGRGFAATEGGS